MNVICRPRGAGKTIDLIKASAELGGSIVCHSKSECRRIKAVAQTMFIKSEIDRVIDPPITYREFLEFKFHHVGAKSFHIDNVDMLVQYISKLPVLTATITS